LNQEKEEENVYQDAGFIYISRDDGLNISLESSLLRISLSAMGSERGQEADDNRGIRIEDVVGLSRAEELRGIDIHAPIVRPKRP
jgi:hypothetical protein